MERKLVLFAVALFSLFIPIYTKIANIGLILVLLSSLFFHYKNRSHLTVFSLRFYLKNSFKTTVFIVMLLVLGLFYTEDLKNALKFFERFSSYLLVPIVFSFYSKVFLQNIKNVAFKSFVIGTFISSCILLFSNFHNYYLFKNKIFVLERDILSYDFTYHVFASVLGFHPVFYGFYIVFALIIILENKTLFHNIMRAFIVLLLAICLLFLNSRSPFLLLAIYIVFYIIRLAFLCIKQRKGRFKLFGMIIIMLLFSIGTSRLLKRTYLYDRISNQIIWELSENKGTSYSGNYKNDSRWSRWKAIYQQGMERPFIGYGSGSEDRIVLKAYEQDGLEYALKAEYGPHNQYLSFFIEYGLIGVVLFLYFLCFNIIENIKTKNVTFLFLFCIIGIGSLFDSILYRNMAIIFFSFFASIFTLINLKQDREK